mmetsp:Transcript_25742/g.56752  ORF Transcript_25742/g.56752 Transcript_25742/m.56752 type:complete len:281 (+) Transcript_25742:40-882(+)|eukprot:CAMPEP_0204277430 /NCGR_PEP_ID=MMETSP0468-20130131/29295_1 /ASSEMBLY_ACC=CAM_ASM_000383 /TAXON_ID=2969 /ORGANISM="Oxyrrhis marina" /LENGTH=280 /DNA_ID=CAMNT_0051254203 /DNA_START=40 /DNA_END=882 /DNA_ORIENTATION=-
MAMENLKALAVSKVGDAGVVHVELNRPKQMNAMNMHMWREIKNVFEELSRDSNCRCVVLSARGKGFTAGLDLRDPEVNAPMAGDAEEDDSARKGIRFMGHVKYLQACLTAIEECLKPVICVIHGACIGGGVDLSAAADVRLCSADAIFSIREVQVGIVADVGTLQRFPKKVGNDSLTRELALTGRDMGAEESCRIGYVSRVLPTKEAAMEDALQMAGVIAESSPVAVVGTKQNLNFARDHSVSDGLHHVAVWNSSQIFTSDMTKAVGAFMTKSKAKFSKL